MPALELKDGQILTEGPAIVQYIADLVPGNTLAPMNGSIERYRMQGALAFISSELHKTVGALFNPRINDESRASIIAKIHERLGQLQQQMDGKDYIANNTLQRRRRLPVRGAELAVAGEYRHRDLAGPAGLRGAHRGTAGGAGGPGGGRPGLSAAQALTRRRTRASAISTMASDSR